MDVLYPRCAGIDVHKRTAVVTVGWVDERGQRHKQTRTYGTMTADLERLRAWLVEQRVTHVAMESTGVYSKPLFNLLEPHVEAVLANAAHVKAVPGRKTDVRDSEWLLDLMQHGLIRGGFIPEDLIFLDETGSSHLGYTPTHAWAPRGQRAYAAAPRYRGENQTVVAALTLDGVGSLLRIDGSMTAPRFEGSVRHILAPTLRPGPVVVADTLQAHHRPAVRSAIEARGARVLPLPSYSPDCNPIEQAFSKVKQALRRAQARTDDDLRAATWATFATITPTDAAGWFAHCGYRPVDRSS
jgi:transposase